MLKSYDADYNWCILALYAGTISTFLKLFKLRAYCRIVYCTHIFLRCRPLCAPSVCDLNRTRNKHTHVGRGSLLVLGDTALQVEGQVVAADQEPLPKLLLELPYVRLDAGEIQFLPDGGDVLKYSSRHGLIRIISSSSDSVIITWVSGSKVKSFRRASLLILDSISLAVCWNKGRRSRH